MAERTLRTILTGQSSGQVRAFQESSSAADKSARDIAGSADRAGGHISKFGGGAADVFKGVASAMAGAFVLDKVVDFVKGGIEQNQIFAKNAAQTAAVIKSTGGAAGVSAGQVRDMAAALEEQTTIAQENIETGENMLLTFTNVQNRAGKGNDIFNQATKTILDMSTAMGTDTQSSAIQLGKALNDPINGITALTRVGVTFSDQQKKQIEDMVKAGNVAGAQKVILSELAKEFGGSAEALGKSPASAVARLQDKLQDMAADLVAKLAPAATIALDIAGKLADVVGDVLAKAFDVVGPAIQTVSGFIQDIVAGFQGASGFVDGFALALDQVGEHLGIFEQGSQEGVKGITGAIKPFADLIGTVVQGVQNFASTIQEKLGPLVVKLMPSVQAAFRGVLQAVQQVMPTITQMVKSAMAAITAVTSTAIDVLSWIWDNFGQTISQVVGTVFGGVVSIISGVAQTLTGIFQFIADALTGKWGKLWDDVKNILGGVGKAIGGIIQNTIIAPIQMIGGVIAKVAEWVSGAFGAITGAFDTVFRWVLVNAINPYVIWPLQSIGDVIGEVARAVSGAFGAVTGAFKAVFLWVYEHTIKPIKEGMEWIASHMNIFGSATSELKNKVHDQLAGLPASQRDQILANNPGLKNFSQFSAAEAQPYTWGIASEKSAGVTYGGKAGVTVVPMSQRGGMGGSSQVTIQQTFELHGSDERLLRQVRQIVRDNNDELERAIHDSKRAA